MKAFAFFLSALSMIALGGLLLLTGCETTDDTGAALTVTPSAPTLSGSTGTVRFEVGGGQTTPTPTNATNSVISSTAAADVDLSLPLVWSVSQPALGRITWSSGRSAIYTRSGGAGVNIVTVRNQYGAEGIATVTQQ